MSTNATALAPDARQLRGKTLAQHARIKKVTDDLWVVPSATHKGTYVVNVTAASCTCPDYEVLTSAEKRGEMNAPVAGHSRATDAFAGSLLGFCLRLRRSGVLGLA